MSPRKSWWNSRPAAIPAILLDAALVFGAILLLAAFIDDEDGWRGGLLFGGAMAAVRLVFNSFLFWNSREPHAR